MLKLHTREIRPLTPVSEPSTFVSRITTNANLPRVLSKDQILLLREPMEDFVPPGYRAYFIVGENQVEKSIEALMNVFSLPIDQAYLDDGDVVTFNPIKFRLNTLYRKSSNHNSVLVTERCNNYCLMCSQPPKTADDGYLVDELLSAIPLMDTETKEIGITGGEPTLLGDRFIDLLVSLKSHLPRTAVHVLTNGRNFKDLDFAAKVAAVQHGDLMFGIPVYSDISNIHDYVVQGDNAFDDTIRGILNLKRFRQKVEIRVVIHKQTFARLPQLARFISRNLLFVDHVALMGLEMMGFTKYNLEELWIDPADYQDELRQAVEILAKYRMNVSIYNHQLCLLDKSLWSFNRKSISDWKNEYMDECGPCTKKDQCGGFFSSARLRYSSHIKAFE